MSFAYHLKSDYLVSQFLQCLSQACWKYIYGNQISHLYISLLICFWETSLTTLSFGLSSFHACSILCGISVIYGLDPQAISHCNLGEALLALQSAASSVLSMDLNTITCIAIIGQDVTAQRMRQQGSDAGPMSPPDSSPSTALTGRATSTPNRTGDKQQKLGL